MKEETAEKILAAVEETLFALFLIVLALFMFLTFFRLTAYGV
jgi:hypothetical protein